MKYSLLGEYMPLKRSLTTPVTSWIYLFLGKIQGKTLQNNKIIYINRKTRLVGSNLFLSIAINFQNKWKIWVTSCITFSCYILCISEGWHFRYVGVVWWVDTFVSAVCGGFD